MGFFNFFHHPKPKPTNKLDCNSSNEIYYYEDFDSKQKNKYQLNSCEKNLLEELKRQLSDSKINKPIRYGFLSNGTMFVCLDGIGQIGRVKLRGRIFRMQIMKMSNSLSDYLDVKWLENITFDECIINIYKWVDYANSQN